MFFLVLLFLLILILGTAAYAGLLAAPWVPTFGKDIDRVLRFVPLTHQDKVVDLGSGDGRVLTALATSGADVHGYEISLLPFLVSKLRIRLKRSANCFVHYKNFWNVNLGEFNVVYLFLLPKVYPRLREKLERELKPGARVVAMLWPVEGWVPIKVDEVRLRPSIYLYQR